jgi:hypothetical protein
MVASVHDHSRGPVPGSQRVSKLRYDWRSWTVSIAILRTACNVRQRLQYAREQGRGYTYERADVGQTTQSRRNTFNNEL